MERTLLGKGFPFDVDKDDVKDFFNPYDNEIEYVYFINNRMGRFTGNCYVTFNTTEVCLNAMKEKHKQYIGSRYINLYKNAGEDAFSHKSYGGGGGG